MVLDLGLLGGWAAGGLAVEAGNTAKSPAGAVDAANADVAALAGAFRQMVDAFADESAVGAIATATGPSATPASPALPVVMPDMFQPNAPTVSDVPVASARRFTLTASTVAATPEAHDDQSDGVEIPFSSFAPTLDPRIDADRPVSTNTANGLVDKDAESESDLERTEQSQAALTPTPLPEPTMTQVIPAASIDTNTMLTNRPMANEFAPQVDVPEGDAPRPAIRAEGRPSAGLSVESASPQIVSKAAPQSAPQFVSQTAPAEAAAAEPALVALRAVESNPVDAANVLAATSAAAPSFRAPLAHRSLGEGGRASAIDREPRVKIVGTSSSPRIDGASSSSPKIDAQVEPVTIEVERTLAMFRASLDAVRPAQASSEFASASLRLAAGLAAAGYATGATARKSSSSNSTGAALTNNPPVVVPFVMPSAASGLASLASHTNVVDMSTSPADVENTAPQIIQTIRLAWSRSGGEAHIRLDPRQFGDLSVSIRLDGGQVVARLQADAPAVREWLQTNQRTLQDQLAEHQLKLTRFEVVSPGEDTKDPSGKDTREQHDEAQGRHGRRPKRQEQGESFEVVA
jgi:flagellar hook-length control protein FliK